MKTAVIVLLSALLSTIVFTSGERLNDFISHYEGLRYSTETLQAKHERVKRAAMGEATPEDVHLAFFAHGRDFHLQLSPDNSMFSKDFQLETSDGVQQIDLSHIYSGYLAGEPGTTMCHGSIINGRFEGFIYTPQGDYYIEPAERYNTSADVHSVIYKAEHVEDPLPGHKTGCGVHGDYTLHEPKSVFPPEEVDDNEVNDHEYNKYADPHKRYRRQTVPTKNTCQIYIMADHKFYAYYGTWEAAVAQLAAHVKAVNAIYRPLVLDDKTGYGVEVTRIRINTTEDALQTDNPFRPDNIGAEAYLDLLSNYNHNPYCLAYGFTDRDFEGTLGLAWVGSICSRYLSYSGRYQSRNTGLVSVQLYGNHVPPKVSHITFAHEVGHSWGSPHDPEGACSPGGEFGNYIMFAQATSGDKNNNNKFSSCSLDSIRRTVGSRSQRCYRPADSAICGNGIVEEGEQCDCGYQDQCDRMGDVCCNGQFQEGSPIACTLKQGAICRDFHLQLSPDNSMFSKDFQLETSDGVQQIDLSHIYSGYLAGEPGTTMCHGSIINGRFEGFIYTPQGDYYIEPAERYNTSADVHSVIYKAEHVEDPLPGHKTGCGVHGDYTLHEPKSVFPPEEVDDNEVNDHEYNKYADPHKRYRRQTVPTKNTCQIYIMADHKFYAYYGTWEAAVAQLAAHVKAVNAIYRPLVLDDKTGYGVEVTRIRHDPEGACSPGGEFGNYIMFAQATSGDKNNNNKFSSCSLDSIRRTVGSRSQRCYRPADSAICGNGIVEEGEQCDCGYQDQCDRMGDVCCNGQFQEGSPIACTLKQGAICSPSQGTCCNTTCTYNPSSFQCADERECAHTSYCSGVSSSCPDPAPKPDLTTMCSEGTRVCLDGQCSESVCRRYGYDRCECKRNSDGTNEEELCHVCCQQQGQPETCRSSKYFPEFNAESPLTLEPGSVCDDNKGYCDNLNRCREVDIDGPLARIKKLVLYGASDWAKTYWWAILLIIIGIAGIVTGIIFCLNAVVPSSIEAAKAEAAGLR
uniref:ADAM10 endopeptidase n=1 Tax=Branchiostoma floridae TaxID=7739 RepID=C3Z0K3_BRAFL|eukprot:XP_002597871.1 hypothetical protein BRAFLDRAFT_128419 [Branchiostoma floridae]